MDRGAWQATVQGSQRVGHDWSDLACTQALRHVGSSLFIAAYRIFRYSMWTLSCSIWDLVPWPGIEPRSPTLGVWHFNHWPTGKSIFTILLFLFWGLAAAAAKSLQSCPTLCNPIDGSPPGSPVPGIPQARTLEWVAISFSNAWKWKVKVNLLSRVRPLASPWTAAYQVPPSMGFSRQEYWSGVPLPSPFWGLKLCETLSRDFTTYA